MLNKFYFYSWQVDGKRFNSALYADEWRRDEAMQKMKYNFPRRAYKGDYIELSELDLLEINNAFNK